MGVIGWVSARRSGMQIALRSHDGKGRQMHATIAENRVHVKLSRRNLRELQAMLDDPGGYRRSLGRMGDNGLILVVEVEDDAEHYERRAPGPGSLAGAYQHCG
jgi:hypothetical protein